jgi:6-pyruvoyltetrahydropterin/6-carboxytetrahydropterin synthase
MLITRKAEFSASHICADPRLSAGENLRLYGKEASNPHGHGHNFVLEVTLQGEPDPVTGMVMDLKEMKDVIEREVVAVMDHRMLNREVPPFDKTIPTPENIAVDVWRRLEPAFSRPGVARLHRVRLWETDDLYVDYYGSDGTAHRGS